ncbi:MAG: metalloregulator ArsR/SmtB family transcription factor [Myxococcaceae bacterium]|nr:metalloregulator ArsR/SmtB family transcription factor [Myxococcaceae bacterium]
MARPDPIDVFKALSDEHRLRMLEFIATADAACCRTGEGVCACDVQDFIGLAQPTVSQHLKLLVQAGLLDVERRGKWNYYTLSADGFSSAQSVLQKLSPARTGARARAGT